MHKCGNMRVSRKRGNCHGFKIEIEDDSIRKKQKVQIDLEKIACTALCNIGTAIQHKNTTYALFDLGCELYEYASSKHYKDIGLKLIQEASKNGVRLAVAMCACMGWGTEKDVNTGFRIFKECVTDTFGNPMPVMYRGSVQYYIGACYFTGMGVERDVTIAVEWLRMAAFLGLARAQWKLGVCYYLGEGVKRDIGEAMVWYRRAATQGHRRAQVELRIMQQSDLSQRVESKNVEETQLIQKIQLIVGEDIWRKSYKSWEMAADRVNITTIVRDLKMKVDSETWQHIKLVLILFLRK